MVLSSMFMRVVRERRGGDFDIAGVTLLAPRSGATVSLLTRYFQLATERIARGLVPLDLFDPNSDATWGYR